MMTVISFQISNLRQQEDFGFHKITLSILGSCDDPKLSPLITTYQAAFQAFDNALKPMNAENVLTLPISQKNEQCVNLYRGIRLQVKAMAGRGYGRLQVSCISPENGVSRMPGICTVK